MSVEKIYATEVIQLHDIRYGDNLENCIFCKIVTKELPSKILYEDDDLIVFHDIRPAAPVHFLIVPKKHIPTLADCTEQETTLLGKMALLAPRLAAEQGCGYRRSDGPGPGSGGYKTIFNVGPDGGQEVYHLHMHVVGGPKPWIVG